MAARLRRIRREVQMRAIRVVAGLGWIVLSITACGGGNGNGNGNGNGGGIDEAACDDCLETFSDDTDDCSAQATACGDAADDLHDFGPCYRAFGACLEDAYDDASSCADDCGDDESADALSCGAYCESD